AALNAALRVLSGDFVCFVDADDVLLPYATSLMIEYLEKNKVDVVFGKIAENYNEIEDYCITDFKTKRYSKPIKETLQSLSVVGATRSLAKVDIIKKAGFCNENIRTQDYQLTLSICRFTDFLFIDKYLAYNLAPKSERFSFDKKREINDINLSLLDFLLKNQDLPKNLIKFGINRCLRRLKRFKKISFFKYIKYKILLIIHISNPSNIITNILTFINK
ncbi:MAG: glycosyltransferase, partial [Alphaproteobacteria bacterium]|nr:glycosyltransferase [Alphaproteobacteria bacterium]